MHRDIFIHMKTYKETCTQTGKKKKKVKSHTHTAANYTINREEEPPHKSSHDTYTIMLSESTHSASITR